MGQTTGGQKRRERERRELSYRIRHSRDEQSAKYVAQVLRTQDELHKHIDTRSAQAVIEPTDPIPTHPGANTSAALPHQVQPDFGCEHSTGDINIDMNEDLPQALVHLHKQLNHGMPTSSLDDELIH
jgi:hypothetical protein